MKTKYIYNLLMNDIEYKYDGVKVDFARSAGLRKSTLSNFLKKLQRENNHIDHFFKTMENMGYEFTIEKIKANR